MSIHNIKIKNVDKKQFFLGLASFAIFSGLIFGGNLFGGGKPLFNSLDNFILFAQEELKIEKGTQVSSGDLGSNKEINIEKDSIINGNLFADKIILDKNVIVNGNVSFNKLKTQKETQILGTKTTPVSLPIANLPEIPDFQVGTKDFKFQGQNNTLAAGNYQDVILEKGSRLILTGGIYNLRKLELKEKSTLIFNAPTTINIQFKLKGQDKVAILPGQNLKPDDLAINYLGILKIQNKKETIKEDDDDEINSYFGDDKERKDYKDHKDGRPVVFGKNSFLNFKLLAPKANIHIGEEATLRGQILAKKIKIEKGGILSREEVFSKESDPTKIVEDQGVKFIVNEIIILMADGATLDDIQAIASIVNGRVVGFLPISKMSKIEVRTTNIADLNQIINKLKTLNSPFITDVLPNFIFQ